MEQTAVQWLVEKLKSQGLLIGDKLVAVREAKQMEKAQHFETYCASIDDNGFINDEVEEKFNQYYKQTYNF